LVSLRRYTKVSCAAYLVRRRRTLRHH